MRRGLGTPGGVIHIDLDGPILDVSDRYFRVHQSIAGQAGRADEAKAEFWGLKREGVPLKGLLARCCPGIDPNDYLRTWLGRIETPEYLRYDAAVPGSIGILESLRARHDLCLVTLRRDRATMMDELEAFGLKRFFVEVLSGYSDTVPSWQVKRELIQRSGRASRCPTMIVGDTEADIVAGKALGITTVAVTNGIRTRAFLETLEPDVIVPDITCLPSVLKRGTLERPSRTHEHAQAEARPEIRGLYGHERF